MREHRLEVADVFRTYEREFFAQWGHVLGSHQRRAFQAIRDCRGLVQWILSGLEKQAENCTRFVEVFVSTSAITMTN
jgi:hypothetical protein